MFRAKNYVELIDTLSDLDSKSGNVTAISEQIEKLEKDCIEILLTVPDNGTACFVKIKYHLTAIVERLKEFCDHCIAENLNTEKPKDLNVNGNFRFLRNHNIHLELFPYILG